MKYRILKWVSFTYTAASVVILMLGVFWGVVELTSPDFTYDVVNMELVETPKSYLTGIGIVLVTILLSLGLFTFGQIIHLLISLEFNTEQTARGIAALVKLQRQQQGLAPTSSMPQSMRKMLKVEEPEF